VKKVRDIPPEIRMELVQTPAYQTKLRLLVEEVGQVTLGRSFMEGSEDDGAPLGALDREILLSCHKPIPDDFGTKHTIYEEGAEVCRSYGVLTLRGLICWKLHSVEAGTWLLPCLTDAGESA
jgi:hypothetical protein